MTTHKVRCTASVMMPPVGFLWNGALLTGPDPEWSFGPVNASGLSTSEQLSLTARSTKRGDSRGRIGRCGRTPRRRGRIGPAVMVHGLGDLVRHHVRWAGCLGSASLALGLVLTACAPAASPPHGPVLPGHWIRFRHLAGVVDLAGPRSDGSFTVAAAGRLHTLTRTGVLRPFARGPGGYSTAVGPEPYIAMAGNERVPAAGCSFPGGTIFALQPGRHPGIIAITPGGRASRFTSLPATTTPDGITFDTTGRFGHRLIVTARTHAATMVLAIDCAGAVRTITSRAPAMEGGIAVAPGSFGRYRG
jgi:hypothetical protein